MTLETSRFMPPGKKTVIAPEDGWKAHTMYTVEVAYSSHNPVHFSLLCVGFLNDDGSPGSYTHIFNPTSEGLDELWEVHYLKVVAELPEDFQIFRDEEEDW